MQLTYNFFHAGNKWCQTSRLTRKLHLFFVVLHCAFLSFLILLALTSTGICENNAESETKTSLIAAPYIAGGSDEGIEFGLSAGISRYPVLMMYFTGSVSTKGYSSTSIRGEFSTGNFRYSGEISGSRVLRYLFPPQPDFPDEYASALIDRLEFNLAMLKPVSDELEFGPKIAIDIAEGNEIEYIDGTPGLSSTLPRFGYGISSQLGLMGRFHTTSTFRPTDGILAELSLLGGNASGVNLEKSVLDFSSEISFVYAKLLSDNWRYYWRGWWGHQHSTAPPNQFSIGGKNTLRGQRDQRYFGRRAVSSRLQLTYSVMERWELPKRVVKAVWKSFPLTDLDIEAVAFYDAGTTGDPEYGWYKTRHGLGAGIRLVSPPEMTFFIDVARSPGGDLRIYMGAGETL